MNNRCPELSPIAGRALSLALMLCVVTAATLASAGSANAQLFGNPDVPTLAPLIEDVGPAVVNISVSGSVAISNPLSQDPFFRRFLPPDEQQREFASAGSGVIVDADQGYILTNHHVVENADRITVILADNRSLEAEVVGSDPGSDIAVLKVEADNLTEMPLGDSDRIRVGDYVLAIGNPFGLQHTVTSGIVSGLGRTGIGPDGAYEDFIQTDASINPGNSGGALVSLTGELVGINSAILSGGGSIGNIGIGFAIPVNMAQNVMEQLIEFGGVRRGLLGVNIVTITPEIADSYDLEATTGALVTLVADGSAAEDAGLEIGDVIVSVDGQSVEDADSLRNSIGLLRPGVTVEVGVVREGREQSMVAVLGELSVAPQPLESLAETDPVFEGGEFVTRNEQSPNYNGVAGILVTQVMPGSPAAARGLRQGDIITHINRQRVRNITEAAGIIASARSVILQVQRGNRGVLILMR